MKTSSINVLLLIFCLPFVSCKEHHSPRAIKKESVKTSLSNPNANLVHCVFLNLKNDLSVSQKSEVISQIENIEKIEGLHDLEIGSFKELGDQRSMAHLELVFTMAFENEVAYKNYQAHPIHLELKSKLGPYLEGPPVTYDYLKKQ